MPAGQFCDCAMAYSPASGLCDLVFDGTRIVLDRTAATALLISVGTDRRADPADVLPGTTTQAAIDAGSPSNRRGWVGDALDPAGQRIGSRLWLLDDAKETEDTRLAAIDYVAEAIAWIAAKGIVTGADASWIRPNTLAILAQAGSLQLRLPRSLV